MNGNTELLDFTAQNAQMGALSISKLLKLELEEPFAQHLRQQQQGYDHLEQKARLLLERHGKEEKGLSLGEKLRTYLMIDMQTLKDKSASHLAGMLVTGSSMGIVQARQKLSQYPHAEGEIRALLEELCRFEEKNVERLKTFL
ncbi:MAG TPA: hypothetical protein H9841_06990 [Candidatus Flavonifractor merdigallinarum]|uniref:DUF2383 domain-containing protein n=1 Tax=Candidatus Flavonifractor merdigallinarum TaxID=2838589 RepID=A0A9D1YC42_9FIRM|nr:hypothetical protein [Candidatus Flavonifractor merdigallinarum]